MRLNGCPRCIQGDMDLAQDIYGEYWKCIQCGHHAELHPLSPLLWNPWKDKKRRGPPSTR